MSQQNPYLSPSDLPDSWRAIEPALTLQQKRYLAALSAFRRNPSALLLFLGEWRVVVGNGLLAGLLVLACALLYFHLGLLLVVAAFAVGLFVGSTASLAGVCRARRRLWPVMERIVDWNKVDALAR